MKKLLFRLSVVALMAMPILMGCEGNDPNRPHGDSGEESTKNSYTIMLEQWLAPDTLHPLDITVENLVGNWKRNGGMVVLESDSQVCLSYEEESFSMDQYNGMFLAVDKDSIHEYDLYKYDSAAVLCYKFANSWELKDNVINYPNEFRPHDLRYTVRVIKPDTVVLSCPTYVNGEDKAELFILFERINAIPELPLSQEEKMMQNLWRVAADSLFHIQIVNETGIEGDNKRQVFGVDANVAPKNMIIDVTKPGKVFFFAENGETLVDLDYGMVGITNLTNLNFYNVRANVDQLNLDTDLECLIDPHTNAVQFASEVWNWPTPEQLLIDRHVFYVEPIKK